MSFLLEDGSLDILEIDFQRTDCCQSTVKLRSATHYIENQFCALYIGKQCLGHVIQNETIPTCLYVIRIVLINIVLVETV